MPRVYDALGRTDELALAMNALLVEGGARAVSLRGACRRSGVSPASAMNHYGNWDRLQALGASLTGQWRYKGIRRRREAGLRAFLPDDAEDLALGRAWLGWQEIGRADARVASVVAVARQDERALLARLTEHELDRPALVALHAALEGLLSAMTLGDDPQDLETACAALDRLVGVLTADARRRSQNPQPAASVAAARSDATIASGSSAE